jgi:hypothetical protein
MNTKLLLTNTCLALAATGALAQSYSIDWWAVTPGGGTLTHGPYSLDGSIGDVSGGTVAGSQGYAISGGFESGAQFAPRAQWVLRATNGPPARYANAMAYDRARGVTVLYGGGQVVPNVGYVGFGEVWEWNGQFWNQRTTYDMSKVWHRDANGYWQQNYFDTPAARLQHAMAYDTHRGRVVMFGGRGAGPENGDFQFNDTWEWDGLRWYFRTTNGPPAQFDHHMAYDERRSVTIVYGGFGASPAVVWEWDGTQWRSITPVHGPVTSYSQDAGPMDYDALLGQAFFGPATDGFTLRFFFSWDGQDWQSRGVGFSDTISPSPNGAMVFDTYRERSFFFGGRGNGDNLCCGGSSSAFYDALNGWSDITDAAQNSVFLSQDFLNPKDFAAKLAGQKDLVSSFLWNQLPNTNQAVLADSASTSDQITAALVPALNAIIRGPLIYDSTRFAGVTLSTETVRFQAIQPVGSDAVRFNRLLLEDAYPTEIRRSPSIPTGRHYHALAFDSARRVAVLQGGMYSSPRLAGNETWELVTPIELVIDQQPISQYRQAGDNALFAVHVTSQPGSVLSYQWFNGSQALADSAHISGAQTSTLRINGVTAADAGDYHVSVSDQRSTISSMPARLSLDQNLQIFKVRAFSLLWGSSNTVLQQADTLSPTNWFVVPGATSPFDVSGLGDAKFFRLTPTPP